MTSGSLCYQADLDGLVFELNGLNFAHNAGSSNELKIFNGLSEAFGRGEIVSLLGPSGCGKTTLLDIIAGIYKSPGNGLHWHTESVRIGYLFQEYPFLPQSTVYKHLAFPLLMAGRAGVEVRGEVEAWLRRVGLKEYSSYPIDCLSVGMRARVALATVLINRPQLLLLDEPFRALDLETRVRMWDHLKASQQAGNSTVLLVTHDLNEAIALSDRVLIFSRTPSSIIARVSLTFDANLNPVQRLATCEAGELHHQLWAGLRHALREEAET